MGINTSHKGLSVRLLRSASLLGLLHLYRFIFVVGVLQVRNSLSIFWPQRRPCLYDRIPADRVYLACLHGATPRSSYSCCCYGQHAEQDRVPQYLGLLWLAIHTSASSEGLPCQPLQLCTASRSSMFGILRSAV